MIEIFRKTIEDSHKEEKVGESQEEIYAAKFICCKGAAARLRVRAEIDILSSLNHPNILSLLRILHLE